MVRPKRNNYAVGIYGEIKYIKQLNKYCSYLEKKVKQWEEKN